MARAKTPPGPISIGLYVFLWILVVLASVLYVMTEMRIVQNRADILPLRDNLTPVSCETSQENEGRLVHIDCPLHQLYTFHPPSEFAWNLRPFRGVFLELKVEMFQWVLRSRWLGFSFRGEWSPNLVDSSSYPFLFYNSHVNPGFMPSVDGTGRRFAPEIFGGGFRLGRKHLLDFQGKKQLPLVDDGYYTPPTEHPPTSVSYRNTRVDENALYTGNPRAPKVGDLRITFWGSTASHVSAIAQQRWNPRDSVVELVPFSSGGGANRTTAVTELVYEGDYTPSRMINTYLANHDGSLFMVWSTRIGTGVLVTLAVLFSYRIFDAAARVAVLPLVAGSALIAAGAMLLAVAPLWLLCNSLRSILFAVSGLILVPLGAVTWSLGARFTRELEEEGSSSLELLAPVVTTTERPAPSTEPVAIAGDTRHFYQPV